MYNVRLAVAAREPGLPLWRKDDQMKSQIAFPCLAMFLSLTAAGGFVPRAAHNKERGGAFSFAGVEYFHRFTKDDQHEFTPNGQEDLSAWTDMVTINIYRKAKDGEALAA